MEHIPGNVLWEKPYDLTVGEISLKLKSPQPSMVFRPETAFGDEFSCAASCLKPRCLNGYSKHGGVTVCRRWTIGKRNGREIRSETRNQKCIVPSANFFSFSIGVIQPQLFESIHKRAGGKGGFPQYIQIEALASRLDGIGKSRPRDKTFLKASPLPNANMKRTLIRLSQRYVTALRTLPGSRALMKGYF